MHRFFVSSQNISNNKIVISDKKQVHYLRDVLRLKADKDKVIVFDEKGNEFSCLIEKVLCGKIILHIQKAHPVPAVKKMISLTIACAIPKKSNMADIIDKLTQLGAERIIPLETKRVIINLDEEKKRLRLERWRKIAQGASLQSQRNTLPIIEPIKTLQEALSGAKDYDLKLIPTLAGRRLALKEVLGAHNLRRVLVFIGPEGDFTDEEVELAKISGCIPVSLGDLVLRVETAAVAVASFIRLNEDR